MPKLTTSGFHTASNRTLLPINSGSRIVVRGVKAHRESGNVPVGPLNLFMWAPWIFLFKLLSFSPSDFVARTDEPVV